MPNLIEVLFGRNKRKSEFFRGPVEYDPAYQEQMRLREMQKLPLYERSNSSMETVMTDDRLVSVVLVEDELQALVLKSFGYKVEKVNTRGGKDVNIIRPGFGTRSGSHEEGYDAAGYIDDALNGRNTQSLCHVECRFRDGSSGWRFSGYNTKGEPEEHSFKYDPAKHKWKEAKGERGRADSDIY